MENWSPPARRARSPVKTLAASLPILWATTRCPREVKESRLLRCVLQSARRQPLSREHLHAARHLRHRHARNSRQGSGLRIAEPAAEARRRLSELRNGIVLVTGPTGSGKSSTLAAIIDKINEEKAYHILTIEDPIEFLHPHKKCTVHQRELHTDTPSFALALRAALRQAPKVILVGEMRDRETIEIAIEAAETGHLVYLHAAHHRRLQNHRAHRRRFPHGRSARHPQSSLQKSSATSFPSA